MKLIAETNKGMAKGKSIIKLFSLQKEKGTEECKVLEEMTIEFTFNIQ